MVNDANKINIASWLLVVGLAAVFLYAAIDSFMSPTEWIGFFPSWMKGIVSDNTLLFIFSIYEILLSFWLLSRKYTFYAAILTAFTTLGIIFANLNQFDITFRDITMVFAALALAVLNREKI